jgi:hypothetical protein
MTSRQICGMSWPRVEGSDLPGMSRGKTYHETIFEASDHPTLARRNLR